MWFTGVEVERETSAPPPKKILDPPLLHHLPRYSLGRIIGPVYSGFHCNLYAESLINFQIVQTLSNITMEDSYIATF